MREKKNQASTPCPGLQAVRSQNWTPGCLPEVGTPIVWVVSLW